MARPHKSTIPYFSHDSDASDSRTVTILENHFGLEGYAVWFKLLERVSASNNQVIDCSNPINVEFLAGKLHINPDKLGVILDKLADLEAIDPQLWTERRIIWCQKLVDRLGDVYRRRQQGPPQRPCPKTVSSPETLVSDGTNPVSVANKVTETPQNGTETPQSKVKESKVKQPPNPQPPGLAAAATIKDALGEIATIYQQNVGDLTPLIGDILKDMVTEYGADWTRDALTKAVKGEHRKLSYVEGILKGWKADGRGPPGNNGRHEKQPEGMDGWTGR